MKGWTRASFLIFLSFYGLIATAQTNVDQLKKEQEKLEEKINLANKLLSKNKDRQKDTELQISLLAKKIETRQKLVRSISAELRDIQSKQQKSEVEIKKLNDQKSDLADAYGEVLRSSYRTKLLKNRWLFLFSAQSLPQLYRRWRYLKQLNDGVKDHLESINQTVQGIDAELTKLETLEQQKQKVLASEEQERKILDQDISQHKSSLSKLGAEASKLNADIKAHHKAQEKLKAAILKSIASSRESGNLPNTPAMTRLSSSFASNRGKLPWPVGKGLIVRSFGKQVHPTLKNVTIVNNGVDITTDPGSAVKAVFEGTVVGQQYIPGYENMVIISHGKYYSVYSYLSAITVTKGEKIKTGDTIGIARNLDGIGQVHLEIWQGKELMDPQTWLMDH